MHFKVLAPPHPSSEEVADRGSGFLASCTGRSYGWNKSAQTLAEEKNIADAIAVRNKKGETLTVGDPKGRAHFVHVQNGNTCSIVAQQQMMRAYGVLPPGDPHEQEDALYEEAVSKGYFWGSRQRGSTPWEFVGSLMRDHGLIIAKHANARDEELIRAVGSGKMVMVDLSTADIWYNNNFRGGGHTVVVTGLEKDKKTEEVLGFYINDSGGVYHAAGRLVPKDRFLKAWHRKGSQFTEVP